jgi:hydroxypyruvate isomerase
MEEKWRALLKSSGEIMNRREFSQLLAAAALTPAVREIDAQASPAQFRFSVMLWTIHNKFPFERCIEIVAAAGYNGVELVDEFNKWSPEETRRMVAKIHSLGLVVDAIGGVNADFSDPGGGGNLLTQLERQMAIAKTLDCPAIVQLSGKHNPNLTPQAQQQASIENLKRAGDLAARHKIQLLIEPIDPIENPPIYLTSVAQGFEIVRAVDSPNVKVLYDFYHEQRAAGNLTEKLVNNIDWVGLVHIADVPGRHEPGTGEIDYHNIYRKLAQLNYNKFIAMEYYPTGDPMQSLKQQRLAALHAARSATEPYQL